MKNIIMINGTMGAGKTAACMELRKILPRNVFLDGDWCWYANPFIVTDETKAMALGNIAHLLNSFIACSAYDNVIFCWVMHRQDILDSLCGMLDLGGCAVRRFTLSVTAEVLAGRLGRDIAAGIREPDILRRAAARLPLYDAMDTVKIDVSAMTPAQAAAAIMERI